MENQQRTNDEIEKDWREFIKLRKSRLEKKN